MTQAPKVLLLLTSFVLLATKARAESETDDSSCAPGAAGVYDLPLHIASIFVLLVASGLGVFLPVVLGEKGSNGGWFGGVFFALKYFGTGIIVSLGFCHLLQDSFETFANECIGELAYEPTAPAIAMGSMLVIWLIDFFCSRWIEKKHEGNPKDICELAKPPSPDGGKSPFIDLCCDSGCKPVVHFDGSKKRAHWDVQLLEGGIVFHSVMIGVSLGAQANGFAATFAALVFHQLFEGLGLGARIGMLVWPATVASTWKKYLMCMVYTLITPIGIAIGIGVHQSFNENGRSELLAIGTLNAISAGILLYSALCQLLYKEWVVGDMRQAESWRVGVALGAMMLGVFAMSLIGKWT
ncbi:hypothetical protein L202_01794 [Cryptococcus amylolentus CBS 6039]|uniref:Zinc/iron permease n=1 Tax=Cryptococcus amylolentus CBS 6039 TaxID=1295533 RepID=A0A1E3I590_9TREE|nr:hypothetical protein L202_01794 [Cryptococcus amylolentus CBS 6039]ODN83698.1 hypothetical protein L202_01794 [Cryptococcus amylolentus CBS 6039]